LRKNRSGCRPWANSMNTGVDAAFGSHRLRPKQRVNGMLQVSEKAFHVRWHMPDEVEKSADRSGGKSEAPIHGILHRASSYGLAAIAQDGHPSCWLHFKGAQCS
jgi:hypothetical protein